MIVIKYGGHVLDHEETAGPIADVIADFHKEGRKVVLVHGGGPAIEKELAFHQVESHSISGYRVTSHAAMEIVQSVLSGTVLRNLTNTFIARGANAVGISSGDGATIRAEKFSPLIDGSILDLGSVGIAESGNPALLNLLLANGYLPIVSPVGVTSNGEPLNLNGDIAAGVIAGSLEAEEVLFITDVPGIYREWPNKASLIHEISLEELKKLAPKLDGGMSPKVKAVITAIEAGAKRARIIDGTNIENLKAALSGQGGTVVTK